MQGLLSNVATGRGWLADLASLRWARLGGLNLTVPASIVLVIGYAVPQLGRDVAGVPFWLAWLIAAPGVVLVLRVFGPMSHATTAIPAAPATTATTATAALSVRTSAAGRTFALRRLTTLQLALVAQIAVVWVLYDILLWQPPSHLHDLNVYLGAA
ncbi:MAG: hypothetical protein ACXWNI_03895 [Candidatus Limnocylindrales bacterium]